MQHLRVEVREEVQQVRAEMRDGFRQVHGRIDRTNESLSLMGSMLNQQTRERFEHLEGRVQALEER
jgi:BMFP domain-containing protein YqiC